MISPYFVSALGGAVSAVTTIVTVVNVIGLSGRRRKRRTINELERIRTKLLSLGVKEMRQFHNFQELKNSQLDMLLVKFKELEVIVDKKETVTGDPRVEETL